MILITFQNQETYQFHNKFIAGIVIELQAQKDIRVVKFRCDKASDYTAIVEYLQLLNTNIQ